MADLKLQTVLMDGLPIETTDAGAAAISVLQGKLADMKGLLETAGNALSKEQAERAADKAKADAEITDLKGKVLDAAGMDAAVKARAKVIDDARKIAGADLAVDGLELTAIRKAAVTKKLGDAAVTGKDDSFFVHAFDLLAVQAASGDQADTTAAPAADAAAAAALSARNGGQPPADHGQAEYERRLNDAWKGEPAGKA